MLYIVATPIGNLEDITYRAVRVLDEVDVVLCEDTRVTRKLLMRYEIDTKTIAVHHHTRTQSLTKIVDRLLGGENMALVTDAGTPGMSDPGNQLVAEAVVAGVEVSPIPGASALAAIVSVAGINMQQFMFLAYPPHKKGRQTFFTRVAHSICDQKMPVVYYDSVHRVIKNLTLLSELAPDANVVVGRELTKVFEEVRRGAVGEVIAHFCEHTSTIKGEFVIVVY